MPSGWAPWNTLGRGGDVKQGSLSWTELRGDSSSEDSADEDDIEHVAVEQAVDDTVGDWYGDLDCDALPPNAEL